MFFMSKLDFFSITGTESWKVAKEIRNRKQSFGSLLKILKLDQQIRVSKFVLHATLLF